MRHRPHLPHILGIFHNGVVAREATHARNVQDGPFGPLLGVAVKRVHPVLACDVRSIIREQQKMIAAGERVEDGQEPARCIG